MPGTIQVSVLEFLDLPSSSSSSLMTVKVSMGKREFQTWDKGDFYFPLMTFRDKLVVTLQDSKGNELSRIGVETMSIVEKGSWDDFFPLEGGGHLHMKLQFILNDEERKRIKDVRESAVKKKHGDFLNSVSLRPPETAAGATVGENFASSSLCLNHEVEDSRETVQPKAVNVGEGSLEDGSEVNSLTTTQLQGPIVLHLTRSNHENLEGETEPQLFPINAPVRPISSHEALDFRLGCTEPFVSKHSVSGTLDEGALERTPSNIRNLISAFESSLAQEPRPSANPPTTKFQSNKIEIEGSLKGTIEERAKIGKTKASQISEKGANIFPRKLREVDLEQSPEYASEKEDRVGLNLQIAYGASDRMHSSQKTEPLEVLGASHTPAEEAFSSGKVGFKEVDKEEIINKDGTFSHDSTEPSITETASVSGRLIDGQPCSLFIDQQGSALSIGLGESRGRTSRENSGKLDICGASYGEQKSVAHSEVEYYPSGNLDCWIFPDEMRHLCVTTGSKQVMDLVGSCSIYTENHWEEMNLSKTETVKEQNCTETNKDEDISHSLRKSEHDRPTDVKFFGGLTGQMVRIAMMVAFGTLVLITRERKTR